MFHAEEGVEKAQFG
jgi:hypothetical protein